MQAWPIVLSGRDLIGVAQVRAEHSLLSHQIRRSLSFRGSVRLFVPSSACYFFPDRDRKNFGIPVASVHPH